MRRRAWEGHGEYRTAVELGRRAIASVDPATDTTLAAALYERQRWYLWEVGDRAAAAAAVAEAERLIPARPLSAARARILARAIAQRLGLVDDAPLPPGPPRPINDRLA